MARASTPVSWMNLTASRGVGVGGGGGEDVVLLAAQDAQLALDGLTPRAWAYLTTSRVSSMFCSRGREEPSIMTEV